MTSPINPAHAIPDWTTPWIAAARARWLLICAGLFATGGAVVALSLSGWLSPTGTAVHVGSFLALYGLIVVLQHAPPARFSPKLQQWLRASVVKSGVGFYGVMTLARFVQLEANDLLNALPGFELSRDLLVGIAKEWLIGFSAQSLRNSIEAFLWPVRLMSTPGMPVAALLVLVAWSVYAIGARVFPEAHGMGGDQAVRS